MDERKDSDLAENWVSKKVGEMVELLGARTVAMKVSVKVEEMVDM